MEGKGVFWKLLMREQLGSAHSKVLHQVVLVMDTPAVPR